MALLHRSDRKGGARNLSCVAGIPEDTTRIAPRERKLARAVQARRRQQGAFIEKSGWAAIPGAEPAHAAVAQACATMLTGLQK